MAEFRHLMWQFQPTCNIFNEFTTLLHKYIPPHKLLQEEYNFVSMSLLQHIVYKFGIPIVYLMV